MATDIYARIGAEIRQRREGRGLSQAQLAERIGVGRTTITMIERGSQALLVHQLLDIASALRTDVTNLLQAAVHQANEPNESVRPSEIEDLLIELDRPVTRITRS